MLTKNGIILTNSYGTTVDSLVGTLKNFSGEDVANGSYSYNHILLANGKDITSSNLKFAGSIAGVGSSYAFLSAGHRNGEATQDTYEPVFNSGLSMIISNANKYAVITLTNTSSASITINEIDISLPGGGDVSQKVLGAVYPIGETTLEPGESISFSFLHA